jgi:hypothetical protein
VNRVHLDKINEIKRDIELTLLNNPESENVVVSYFS